jgi:glycosyltransferase involved in cell wall biosynthesis
MRTLGIDASRANQAHRTGVPQYTYCLIQELKKLIPAQVRVTLYSPTPLQGELAALPGGWSTRVLRWPFTKLWNQVRLAAEMLVRPPDVLLLPHHLMPAVRPRRTVAIVYDIGFERQEGLYGTAEQQAGRRTLVQAALDLTVRVLSRGRYRLCEQDYHRLTMRHAVARASRLIAISEFTRQELAAVYGVDPGAVDLAYPGIYPEEFATPVPEEQLAAVLARYGIRKPYLLFVGRLEQKKNVRNLVEAFAILKREDGVAHQLVLAGRPGHGHDAIRQAIEENGVVEDVVETGWVADEDLPALLQGARLFIFPSSYEGFGIPILQAQAAGTPVACSDIPVMREAAGPGAVYFDQGSPTDMARVAASALREPGEGEARSAAGQRNLGRFTWSATAGVVWETIQEVSLDIL